MSNNELVTEKRESYTAAKVRLLRYLGWHRMYATTEISLVTSKTKHNKETLHHNKGGDLL